MLIHGNGKHIVSIKSHSDHDDSAVILNLFRHDYILSDNYVPPPERINLSIFSLNHF